MRTLAIIILTAIVTIVIAEDFVFETPVAQATQTGIRCERVDYDLNNRTWNVDLRKLMSDGSTESYRNYEAMQVKQDDVYAYLDAYGITPVSTNWMQTMELFLQGVKTLAVSQVTSTNSAE